MTEKAKSEYLRWAASEKLTEEERAALARIEGDDEAVEMHFGALMSFGTAGLRSTMDLGPGCMNRFTVAGTTAALATLVKAADGADRGVAIAYDSRNNSAVFAQTAASVLAGYGVHAYLFDGVRPTPELSFAIRDLHAIAGINITASHNPREYNGYKAYWEDGAQIAPEQAKIVAAAMEKTDPIGEIPAMPLTEAIEKGLVTMLDASYDERYLAAVQKTAINPDLIREVSDSLKIVYTPLHGAGYRLVPEILTRMGLRHLYKVDSQMTLDGNFPTVKKPNPEYPDVFVPGIEIADRVGSDLIIATDPDADRVGVMSRNRDGRFVTITGNQMGALLLDYVIRGKRERGELTSDDYAVKSLVSTELAAKIAERNGIRFYNVLTGFKFIGEVILNYERSGAPGSFLLGFEESYGYLFGTYARDKDAVGATMMITEMTAYYRRMGKTLSDALLDLYAEYGIYREGMIDIYMEGLDGIERRRRIMQSLRDEAPAMLGGEPVAVVYDLLNQTASGVTGAAPLELPPSDVLILELANRDRIIVRPSGTEPKIKIYLLVSANSNEEAEAKLAAYEKDGKALAD